MIGPLRPLGESCRQLPGEFPLSTWPLQNALSMPWPGGAVSLVGSYGNGIPSGNLMTFT